MYLMKFLISFRFNVIVILTILGITAPNKSDSQNKINEAKKNTIHAKYSKIAKASVLKSDAKRYKLVWADEFNAAGALDTSKWGFDVGTGEWGWGNNEKEYYTSRLQNASILNGVLKISAQKENFKNCKYTSARIVTNNKFSFTYGKVVARAKLPKGVGTWPAIWLLGSNVNTQKWPACGEIDIMEHKGSEPNKIYSTLHYPNHSGDKGDSSTIIVNNVCTQFHIYSMEWTPTSINFYVDDVKHKTFINTSETVFNHDFYLIINLAMGGLFAGPIEENFKSANFEIDYIRVYQ